MSTSVSSQCRSARVQFHGEVLVLYTVYPAVMVSPSPQVLHHAVEEADVKQTSNDVHTEYLLQATSMGWTTHQHPQ